MYSYYYYIVYLSEILQRIKDKLETLLDLGYGEKRYVSYFHEI